MAGCGTASPDLLATIQAKLPRCDPLLHLRRFDFLQNLLIASAADLTPARSAIATALAAVPGYFGRWLADLFGMGLDEAVRLRDLIHKHAPDFPLVVQNWHRYLDEAVSSITASKNGKAVLTAFSLVVDQTLQLDQPLVNKLLDEVRKAGISEADVLSRALNNRNAAGGELDREAVDVADVLALIVRVMQGASPKPVVRNRELQDRLADWFKDAPRSLGGAAANKAAVLGEMGFPVWVHCPYNNQEQARAAPTPLERLVYSKSNGTWDRHQMCSNHDENVPHRSSYIFVVAPQAHTNGPVVTLQRQEFRPCRADRLILQLPYPRLAGADWDSVEIRGATSGSVPTTLSRAAHFAGLGPGDWPWFPLFQSTKLDGTTIRVCLRSSDEMAKLNDNIRTVLLGGFQALVGKEDWKQELRKALTAQLAALKAPKCYELYGVTKPTDLDILKELFNNSGVYLVSMNREDLMAATRQRGSHYLAWEGGFGREDTYCRYLRAKKFKEEFECPALYVHDLELDLLLVSDAKEPALLERYRQAMLSAKVVVPAMLLLRAGLLADVRWDLRLSDVSLLNLVDFADRYAAGDKQIFRELLENGFHHNVGGVSPVIAPAVYVEFPEGVSLTGAGDMCFAVLAAMLA